MNPVIDINCDLGEGIGNDRQLMRFIDSCSIACGGHYGSEKSIRQTIKLAVKYKVKVGAHPSFPDPINFGRIIINLTSEELKASIIKQVGLFQSVCQSEGVEMNHVKLHGALYNLAARDRQTANTVLEALETFDTPFLIYTPYQSALASAAINRFKVKNEAFIDRTYQQDGSLTPRTAKNALIHDPEKAWEQLLSIALENRVAISSKGYIDIKGETFCVHGDGKNCLEILSHIRKKLNHV